MRREISRFAAAICLAGLSVGASLAQQGQQPPAAPAGQGQARPATAAAPLRLMSPAFSDGAILPTQYTCSAGPAAVSPPLRWTNAPTARTMVTFALIVHDLEPRPGKGVD